MSFEQEIENVVPSVFTLIGSSNDDEQSNESANVKKFGLRNAAGKYGGACTSSFLCCQQFEAKKNETWFGTLESMCGTLDRLGYPQTPVLCSSRKMDHRTPMHIIPPGCCGRKRAVLIGINYVGQSDYQLRSCHFDCLNTKSFLINKLGFKEQEMTVLMDDGNNIAPTKQNIASALIELVNDSQPGDVNFISFSGHGGRIEDSNREDGWKSGLSPVDAKEEGMIFNDDVLTMLVKPMKAGVTTTVLMDCCHAGNILDLPYKSTPTDTGEIRMKPHRGYNMDIVTEPIRPLSKQEKHARHSPAR